MKYQCLFLCLISWIFSGCRTPEPLDPASETPSIEGLKITDLEDNSPPVDSESLMRFRVLTYTLIPDLVDRLGEVFDGLSSKEIRVANKVAFHANGFSIAAASFAQGVQIAKKLSQMGAVRTAQVRLILPPDSTEALSRTLLHGSEGVHYVQFSGRTAMIPPRQGFLGWVVSARPDPKFRGMAQVNLFPAAWQPGIENVRLVMGDEAVDYQPVNEGKVLARIEEGGLILLGPCRSMPDEMTLDKRLFFLPGQRPRIQFFVIICDSAGN